MTDPEQGVRRLPGSGWRRDRHEGGRRPIQIKVRATIEEHAVLEVLAADAGVSIPKLLIESAHAAARGGQTVSQHREQLYELVAIRRLLANVANNVNQIAKAANSGGLDGVEDQARAVFATVRRVADRIMDVVDEGTAR